MSVNKYQYSKAYFRILDLIQNNPNEDVFVIRGGQGAGKTISILQLIIQSLLKSEKEATVLSSELSKMKRTVVRDYKKICKDWGVIANDTDFNKSESKHEYPNDSYLDFIGADVSDVGKGFRRDILYINEADKINIDSAVQFISRAKLTIIDYNPDSLFWGDDYINDNNFITLTFEDNEFLSESEVRSILEYKEKGFYDHTLPIEYLFDESNIRNKYWANKHRVYALGLVGSLDGVVFSNWTQCDKMPEAYKWKAYGIDWGFTNDPTAVVEVCEFDGKLWLNEILYDKGLTNADIAAKIGGFKGQEFIADSAEPKSIEDLRRHGFRIRACQKGRDSVRAGIDKMQQYPLVVTSNSVNLIRELRGYVWSTDRTGEQTGEPIDDFNHAIDASRYIIMEKLKARSGQYAIR